MFQSAARQFRFAFSVIILLLRDRPLSGKVHPAETVRPVNLAGSFARTAPKTSMQQLQYPVIGVCLPNTWPSKGSQ